jgi:hypothetical protein
LASPLVATRVRNITDALAHVGFSAAVAEKLAEEERKLAALRATTTKARPLKKGMSCPHRGQLERYLEDLLRLLEVDTIRGREVLVRHLTPVVMTPKGEGPDRHYVATGAFNLALTLRTAGKSSSGGERSEQTRLKISFEFDFEPWHISRR